MVCPTGSPAGCLREWDTRGPRHATNYGGNNCAAGNVDYSRARRYTGGRGRTFSDGRAQRHGCPERDGNAQRDGRGDEAPGKQRTI